MTVEQQGDKIELFKDFGDIPINPHWDSGDDEQQESAECCEDLNPSNQKLDGRFSNKGVYFIIILFLLPVALFLLYLAGARYLLPLYIKGPLADRLGQRLNRSVTVKDAQFSPFSFDLHLSGIDIGADHDRRNAIETEPEFCRIEFLDTRMRPAELLRRKFVFEDVRIKHMRANFIRYADGTYTELVRKENGSEKELIDKLNILPPWMSVQGLRLTDSAVFFHDQTSGKQHVINEIDLTLPSAESQQNIIKPTLHAVVNGSPVLIQGQRHIRVDGGVETKLSLLLDDIDPQKYLAWVPGINDSLRISTDKTDAALEIIMQDKQGSGTGLSVSGTVSMSGLQIDSLRSRESAPQKAIHFAAPKAELIIRASPLHNLYTVEKLTLEQPLLTLSGNDGKAPLDAEQLLAMLGEWLNPSVPHFGLEIRQLTINNGSIRNTNNARKRREWRNLRVDLTDFQNARAATLIDVEGKTSLALTGEHGGARIKFQGTVTPDLILSGKIFLRNMRLSLVRPYLSATDTVHFSKGKADLTGFLLIEQAEGTKNKKRKMLIERGTIKLRDFTLAEKEHRKEKESSLVTGKIMEGTGCSIDTSAHTASCDTLLVRQAAFSAEAPAFFLSLNKKNKKQPLNTLTFSSNTLKIVDCTARLPLSGSQKEGKQLLLSTLNINLTELWTNRPRQNNLSLQATVGQEGKISAGGFFHKGKGGIQLTASELDINLFQKSFAGFFKEELTPSLKQGRLFFKGRFNIPVGDFLGNFHLDNLIAGNGKGTAVRWRQGSGDKVTGKLSPFSVNIGEFTLLDPVVELPSAESKLPEALFALLRTQDNQAVLPPFTVEQCRIRNGTLLRKGESEDKPGFSEIEG
ncbi:MAG: DUF748 domain-containing protein, partial [Candidatus Electrothrix sp. AR4]|nr:DUF748 domain-containing protein [Candidatus Electrothrix sp. AR4]